MTPASLHPNERFSLCRFSYLFLQSTCRRPGLQRSQAGIAVERCAVRRQSKGFRLPIPPTRFRGWRIRRPRGAHDDSTIYLDENWEGNETDNVEISIDGDVYRSTLRLVECAMFAAVTGLVYYRSNSLAIEKAAEAELLAKFPYGGVILRPGFIHGTRQVGCMKLPLGIIGSPIEMVLQPAKPLSQLPLVGPAFLPPVSVTSVAKVAVRGATDPAFPPGVVDVFSILRYGQ